MNPRALIRHADTGRWLEFVDPVDVVEATSPAQVPGVVDAIEARARQEGLYAIGFLTYEAAPGLATKHVTHPPGRLPAAWFALYPEARHPEAGPAAGAETAPSLFWRPNLDAAAYRHAVQRIRNYIGAGDSYQVNFSYRLRALLEEPVTQSRQLFAAMIARQPAGYGAYLETDAWAICCASPELFFTRQGRRLTSRPMKGTAPRGESAREDAERARWLAESVKNRAENLMITDMVRNDIGRLAAPGSVRTEGLFRLEHHPTLWQMTSTVHGDTGATLSDILRALFPAASITGAPKRRTMDIIRELEAGPREIYTGTVGFVAPEGDAQFNVAIRTAWVDKRRGTAEYGVGGGILWDSDPAEEFEETRTKARILHPAPLSTGFCLLETLLWEPDCGFFLLEAHLERLQRGARHFCRPMDIVQVRGRLTELAQNFPGVPHRVRVLVNADGDVQTGGEPLDPASRPARVVLARLPSPVLDNPFVSHKTDRRELYEDARLQAQAGAPEADDVLLVNERGEVTESTVANLVIDIQGTLLTPPESSGLLAGVYRQHLLDTGRIVERIVRPDDVRAGNALYLLNSLRRMWPVTLIERRDDPTSNKE